MASGRSAEEQAAHRIAIEEQVKRLSEALKSARGDISLAPRLHKTSVDVLAARHNSHSQSFNLGQQYKKDAETSREAICQRCSRPKEFRRSCQQLSDAGVPKLDEFIITLSNIGRAEHIREAVGYGLRDALRPPPVDSEASGRRDSAGMHTPAGLSAAAPAPMPRLPATTVAETPLYTKRLGRPPITPGSNWSLKEGESSGARRRPTVVAPDVAETPMSVASAAAEPYVPTPASTVRSTGKENETSCANGRPSDWLSDHRNPMYGQVGVNSPFKSGADYWRESSEPSRLSMDGTDGPQMPALAPVGRLFDFRAMMGPEATTAESAKSSLPSMPDWLYRRPHLTGEDILKGAEAPRVDVAEAQPLHSFPRSVQEHILVDDLLFAFMGLDGKYVRATKVVQPDGVHISYRLHTQANPALRELSTRMLALCDSVAIIGRWCEVAMRYEQGRVSHAVAGCMRSLLQDWHLMVTQLEHQLLTSHLTLQGLWYFVQPPLTSLGLAASIAAEAASQELRGAPLLNMLHVKAASVSGDAAARALVKKLLKAGCQPYFQMLEKWLCEGDLDDPFQEFMICQDSAVGRDAVTPDNHSGFWHQRYTLRGAAASGGSGRQSQGPDAEATARHIPVFLESLRGAILTTGKYLNAIKESGSQVLRPLPANVHIEYGADGTYVQHINKAFAAAAAALMELMTGREGLPDMLQAFKSYFLLARGDLFTTFLELAEAELERNATDVTVTRLQSLLELGVRLSTAASDKHAERLRMCINPLPITNLLTNVLRAPGSASAMTSMRPSTLKAHEVALRNKKGREVLMMDLKNCVAGLGRGFRVQVEWPLNMVVDRSTQNLYQALLRHLLGLAMVERELHIIWRTYQSTRALFRVPEPGLKTAYGLCQQMTHFFHQLRLYITFEVIEPAWLHMHARMKAAKTLDEVMEAHGAYLKRILKGTLLSRKVKLLQQLNSIINVGHRFGETTRRLEEKTALDPVPLEDPATGKILNLPEREIHRTRAQRMEKAVRTHVGTFKHNDGVNKLQAEFTRNFQAFMEGLEELYKGAVSSSMETREELDGLLNLINRLDFSKTGETDYRELLGHPTLPSRASA